MRSQMLLLQTSDDLMYNFLGNQCSRYIKSLLYSLGFAFVPSFCLFLGGVFLPDSPHSLLERGHHKQAGLQGLG